MMCCCPLCPEQTVLRWWMKVRGHSCEHHLRIEWQLVDNFHRDEKWVVRKMCSSSLALDTVLKGQQPQGTGSSVTLACCYGHFYLILLHSTRLPVPTKWNLKKSVLGTYTPSCGNTWFWKYSLVTPTFMRTLFINVCDSLISYVKVFIFHLTNASIITFSINQRLSPCRWQILASWIDNSNESIPIKAFLVANQKVHEVCLMRFLLFILPLPFISPSHSRPKCPRSCFYLLHTK